MQELPNPKTQIRKATAADIPAIVEVAAESATASAWSAEQYQGILSGSGLSRIVLVLEQGVTLQGFLVARAVDSEWELENIAVANAARRLGYGTRLMASLLEKARQQGAEAVFLEVRASNVASRALYENCSFVECGRRRAYYDGTEDAILYRLDLK